MAEESLRGELIKHISAEITTQAEYLATFRSRMGFTVLVGPFLVLGSVLIATKSAPTALGWPTGCLAWGSLIGAVLFFLLFGVCGACLDKFGTEQCDFWRKELLSVAKDEPLDKVKLIVTHHFFVAYIPVFALSLLAFLSMTVFLLSMLHPAGAHP